MFHKLFLLSSAIVLFSSCGEDKDKSQQIALVGKWTVYASEMNQKTNEFMKDAFFEFHGDNSIVSNLFDGNKNLSFHVAESRLKIDSEEEFDLKITRLDSDTLILEGKMKVFQMKFYLKKL
jgi:hypothetical protein